MSRDRITKRVGLSEARTIGVLMVLLMAVGAGCDDVDPARSTPLAADVATATPRAPMAVEPTPSPTPVPMHSVLSAALEAMRDVDSFHFMEGFSKNSGVFGTLSGTDYDVTFEATGEYKSPDRLHRRAVIHGVDYPTESNLQTISIGYTRYVTDPDTGEWGRPADSFRDQDLFGNPIEVFEGVVALLGLGAYRGIVESGGVRVHRFSYRTPDLYLSGPKVHAFDAEILVGVDDLLVRELRTESKWRQRPCKPDQKCLAIEIVPGWRRLTVQFSYPDEGVTIEAPQIQSP